MVRAENSMTARKRLERRAGYFGFRLAERLFLSKDPLRAEDMGAKLGNLAFRLSRKHRLRALSNLELAFPDMPEAERVELARRCFRHFGRLTADFLKSAARTDDEVLATCRFDGFEYLDAALARGKGAILITGHLGNWERASHCVVARGYPLTVVARDANDGDLNRHVDRIRKAHGVEILSRGAAARGILTRLKKNEVIGILVDQNSGDLFVPFFGKPCGTVTGPSSIHFKTEAPLLPFVSAWEGPGRYSAQIGSPLVPEPGFEPVEGMTRAINCALEAAIRQTPEQWLWFHDRWKSARRAGLL